MKNRLKYLFTLLGITTYLLTSCSNKESVPNQLTSQEKEDGWQLLFDGTSLEGWHLYNRGEVPSAWTVQDGELYCQPIFDTTAHGDLVSDQAFKNYELAFEWKISEGGNSGVFINVLEREDIPTTWSSGPEYQLLDKAHPDYEMSPAKRPGTLFNFYPPINPVEPKPAGEWNQSRIKQIDGKVEFYLNGVLTAQEDFNSDHWKESVANSGFKTFPEFGKHVQGHIALQDWSKGISFRNVKIKTL
jgi:hypothetical protein